jgi:hypothetical protein
MDQLNYRNNRDVEHFNEDDWTLLRWQDSRELEALATQGKDNNTKDSSKSDTVIGVVYVCALVTFMLAYLT